MRGLAAAGRPARHYAAAFRSPRGPGRMKLRLFVWSAAIVLGLGVAHVWLNVGWTQFRENLRTSLGGERQEMIVGFLPVTCHLTCPVTSWVTEHSERGSVF